MAGERRRRDSLYAGWQDEGFETPNLWARHLPSWAGNLLERMRLVVDGLLMLMLMLVQALSRFVPPLCAFRVRSRVFRWYARLREVEARLAADAAERDALLDELTNWTAHPPHCGAVVLCRRLYALRNNMHAVRKRLLAQRARPSGGPTD